MPCGVKVVRQGGLALWLCTLLILGGGNRGWGQEPDETPVEAAPQPYSPNAPFHTPLPPQSIPAPQPIDHVPVEQESQSVSESSSPIFDVIEIKPKPVEESVVCDDKDECSDKDESKKKTKWFEPRFYLDYDGGFVIRPFDKEKDPYELKVRLRMQFRYVGFSRDIRTWTDNAGVTRPVDPRSDFEIERGRLEFAGFFLDPKLHYYINIDADTDDNHDAKFHDFWINYVFSDAFDLYIGKAFVPGSRDWLNGSTRTHLADRSMATTFFRPDRSLGVWAIGEPLEGLHYRAMIGNGFDTTDFEPEDIDNRFMYSGSVWWEPLGDFGKGYADLEYHDSLVVQVGNSFTFAAQKPFDDGTPRREQFYAQLSDGTRLVDPGALAPGVTVNAFDTFLYAIDLAAKYRGWSINGEYFFRWLNDFGTVGGPIPHSQLYDHGFYVDCGVMLIEKKLEVVGRISTVNGLLGDAWEYAAGVNWYVNGKHSNKLTADISFLDGNPSSNSGPNYVPGQDGILFRVQWQIAAY